MEQQKYMLVTKYMLHMGNETFNFVTELATHALSVLWQFRPLSSTWPETEVHPTCKTKTTVCYISAHY